MDQAIYFVKARIQNLLMKDQLRSDSNFSLWDITSVLDEGVQ